MLSIDIKFIPKKASVTLYSKKLVDNKSQEIAPTSSKDTLGKKVLQNRSPKMADAQGMKKVQKTSFSFLKAVGANRPAGRYHREWSLQLIPFQSIFIFTQDRPNSGNPQVPKANNAF